MAGKGYARPHGERQPNARERADIYDNRQVQFSAERAEHATARPPALLRRTHRPGSELYVSHRRPDWSLQYRTYILSIGDLRQSGRRKSKAWSRWRSDHG